VCRSVAQESSSLPSTSLAAPGGGRPKPSSVDPSTVAAAASDWLGDAELASAGQSEAAAAALARGVPDRLIFDTVVEVIAAACPPPDIAAVRGGSSVAAATAVNLGAAGVGAGAAGRAGAGAGAGASGRLAGDRLAAYVTARVAASLAPSAAARGGRESVDSIVRDDVRASDDLGWYDLRATERAIALRLSEEIWAELVEDTIRSGITC